MNRKFLLICFAVILLAGCETIHLNVDGIVDERPVLIARPIRPPERPVLIAKPIRSPVKTMKKCRFDNFLGTIVCHTKKVRKKCHLNPSDGTRWCRRTVKHKKCRRIDGRQNCTRNTTRRDCYFDAFNNRIGCSTVLR